MPFDNDDEEAAAMATGRLTENMHAAKTRAEQDEALAMLMRFMNHERDKRLHDPE